MTHDPLEFLGVVRHAAARASQRKSGANDRREAQFGLVLLGLFKAVDKGPARHVQPGPVHGGFEEFAVLGHLDRVDSRTNHLDVVLGEGSAFGQGHRRVERSLAAERRQEGLRLFLGYDPRANLRRNRLDVRSGGPPLDRS